MRRTSVLLLFALSLGTGCSNRATDASRLETFPVAGTLLVDGQPAMDAHVAFYPVGGSRPMCSVGMTGSDGTFRLTTYAAGDGAPDGEYVVTVFWPDPSMPADPCECPDPIVHDRLRGRYIDARTSELRATVGPGGATITLSTAVGASWNTSRKVTGHTPLDLAARERARNSGELFGPSPSDKK
jgi:hypothetical protein